MSEKIEFEATAYSVYGSEPETWIKLPHSAIAGEKYRVTLEPIKPEPKPCPFCGNKANISFGFSANSAKPLWSSEPDRYCVTCLTCEARGAMRPTESGAILAWNSREG